MASAQGGADRRRARCGQRRTTLPLPAMRCVSFGWPWYVTSPLPAIENVQRRRGAYLRIAAARDADADVVGVERRRINVAAAGDAHAQAPGAAGEGDVAAAGNAQFERRGLQLVQPHVARAADGDVERIDDEPAAARLAGAVDGQRPQRDHVHRHERLRALGPPGAGLEADLERRPLRARHDFGDEQGLDLLVGVHLDGRLAALAQHQVDRRAQRHRIEAGHRPGDGLRGQGGRGGKGQHAQQGGQREREGAG